MRVLTMATAKGGTGKSTLAAGLAVAAVQSGEKVYLIDLDPQESLLTWAKQREVDEPGVDRCSIDQIEPALAGLRRKGYTLAILDTAGMDNAASAEAMKLADFVLVPARPSALDINGAKPTVAALIELQKNFAFVANCCPAGKIARVDDASRALVLFGGLAKPVIVQRADHMDAMALGLGVTEFNPAGKAAEEIRALWGWVKRSMRDDHTARAAAAV